jgi:hypothetical protein
MTTRQLFLTINQIYLNKTLLRSIFENYDIIISSHDNYYEVSHHKPNGTLIKFKVEVQHSPISHSKYILNYRFTNNISNIAQSNTLTSKDQIPQLIEKLLIPIIREMKIDNILDQ